MKKSVFFATVILATLAAGVSFAQTGDASAAAYTGGSVGSALAFGTALLMAVASGVGTFSQSRAASAALEGIARNPQAADKVQTPLILSLALMESLVIFAFVIALFLQGKIK